MKKVIVAAIALGFSSIAMAKDYTCSNGEVTVTATQQADSSLYSLELTSEAGTEAIGAAQGFLGTGNDATFLANSESATLLIDYRGVAELAWAEKTYTGLICE